MKFIFITVNYNNSEMTVKYLKSLESIDNIQKFDVKTIIVDNKSEISDFKTLKKFIDEYNFNGISIELIKNEKNKGYFGGLNTALKSQNVDQDTFVIIGNNDLTFNIDFIDKITNSQYEKDVMVIAPDVVTKDGIHQNPHCISRVTLIRKVLYELYYKNYYFGKLIRFPIFLLKRFANSKSQKINRKMYIHMGIGACYILTPRFFEYYSLLDDNVFLWGEEAFLSNQVLQANGKILYDPDLIVFHHESSSVKKITSKKSWEIQKESFKKYKKYL